MQLLPFVNLEPAIYQKTAPSGISMHWGPIVPTTTSPSFLLENEGAPKKL